MSHPRQALLGKLCVRCETHVSWVGIRGLCQACIQEEKEAEDQ